MDVLLTVINQTLKLPLVHHASLNLEGDIVVVELKVNPRAGLLRENTLFFRAPSFSVEQVGKAILKIRKELASLD